jgi:hypothetical protein
MADVRLEGSTGGNVAKVDVNQRLHTSAVTQSEADHACDTGIEQKYNINTGDITITNSTKLTLLYIKNTSDNDLVIKAFIYNLGNTTSGTGDVLLDVYRNPTAGGIITNGNDVQVGSGASANQNFGSSNTLSGSFFKGAQGETAVSGGAETILTRSASTTGRIVIALDALVIPKNQSVAVNYTPPASNTSQTVQIAAACYLRTPEVAVAA